MSAAASGSQRPEDLNAKLQTRVPGYQLQANNFVEALTRVAADFRIPMGIEWVNTPAAKAKVSLSWKNVTAWEVLRAVVNTQPSFKIAVRNGIVDVSCPDLIPDRENPFKVKINEFEVHNARVESASRQLQEIVNRTISPPKPQGGRGGIGMSGFSNADDPKISVQLSNATVEDALDALALASARKIWIVTFSANRTLTAAGYRRTGGLWTSRLVPDNEQPVWDQFHWGDPIPEVAVRPN
jgi:hypothetical protein